MKDSNVMIVIKSVFPIMIYFALASIIFVLMVSKEDSVARSIEYAVILAAVVLIILMLPYPDIFREEEERFFGTGIPQGAGIVMGFIGIVATTYIVVLITSLVGRTMGKSGLQYGAMEYFLHDTNPNQLILELTFIVVIAPIAGEFVFRGIMYHNLSIIMSRRAAVLVSSLAFGFMHFNNIQAIFTSFVLGLFFACIYAIYRSMVINIVIHVISNLIMVLFHYGAIDDFVCMQNISQNAIIKTAITVIILGLCGFIIWRGIFIRLKVMDNKDNHNAEEDDVRCYFDEQTDRVHNGL